jgi:hypothetical protein
VRLSRPTPSLGSSLDFDSSFSTTTLPISNPPSLVLDISLRGKTYSSFGGYKRKNFIRLASIFLLLILFRYPMQGQSVANTSPAIVIVKQAIATMGGEANWASVGAATSEAEIAVGSTTISRQAEWSDDWSSGHGQFLRSARDSVGNAKAVGKAGSRTLKSADGHVKSVPLENDIAVLAVGYPAAALLVSLHRTECRFVVREPSGEARTEQERVYEVCADPSYSNGQVQFEWIFSRSTGLPISLVRPVRELLRGGTSREQVDYTEYQTVQGLRTPVSLAIHRPGGSTDAISLSSTRFLSSLPSETFQF